MTTKAQFFDLHTRGIGYLNRVREVTVKKGNPFMAGRGRDGSYLPPPAQIRTCGTTAYGSCLRFVTRSVPPDRDVQFWASVCRCLRDDQSVTTGLGYAGCAA